MRKLMLGATLALTSVGAAVACKVTCSVSPDGQWAYCSGSNGCSGGYWVYLGTLEP